MTLSVSQIPDFRVSADPLESPATVPFLRVLAASGRLAERDRVQVPRIHP